MDPRDIKRCAFCGTKRNLRIHHINGNESHTFPENLIGACHSCNLKIASVLKRHRIGRRVKINPEGISGARSLAQWVMAVKAMRGESDDMTVNDAVAMIRATPSSRRSRFAEDIWKIRRARGTDRTAAPF